MPRDGDSAPVPDGTAIAPSPVCREFFIPLWPNYSGGRWHLGFQGGVWYPRARVGEPREEPLDEFLPVEAIVP